MSAIALRDERGIEAVIVTPDECAVLGPMLVTAIRLLDGARRNNGAPPVPRELTAIVSRIDDTGRKAREQDLSVPHRDHTDQGERVTPSSAQRADRMMPMTDAARVLGHRDPSHLRKLARHGRLPGARKIGRDWQVPTTTIERLKEATQR